MGFLHRWSLTTAYLSCCIHNRVWIGPQQHIQAHMYNVHMRGPVETGLTGLVATALTNHKAHRLHFLMYETHIRICSVLIDL